MPTFDIVCELDHHELANAVDQSNREIANRFDFKILAGLAGRSFVFNASQMDDVKFSV